jgi:hypothetical protein
VGGGDGVGFQEALGEGFKRGRFYVSHALLGFCF